MWNSIQHRLWSLKIMMFAVLFEMGGHRFGVGWTVAARWESARRLFGPLFPGIGRMRTRLPAAETEASQGSERGDVPGWVLVTLMTAGLVIAIWAVAGPALVNVFNTAITRITSI